MGPGGGGGGGGSGDGEALSSDCAGASDLQDLGSEEEGSEVEGSESTEVSPAGSGSGSAWEASFQNGHKVDEGKQEENNTNNSNSSSSGGSSAHASPVPINSTPNFTGEICFIHFIY